MGSSNTELDNLVSKLRVVTCVTHEDKQAFCAMFNYVFDPPLPLSPPNRSSRKRGFQCEQETINPAIREFETVFKTHFRRNPFIDFAAACQEAEGELWESLDKQMATSANLDAADELSQEFQENVWPQIIAERGWLEKMNEWKRDNFQRSAREDGMRKFRRQLSAAYSFEDGKFYEEPDISSFLAELKTTVLREFVAEIPTFEKGLQWRLKLGLEMAKVGNAALDANRRNADWEQITAQALIQYKLDLENFLKKRQFARNDAVNAFHVQAKAKCEEEQGLAEFLDDPVLKSKWDEKIGETCRVIKGKRKAMADSEISSFVGALKVETRRMVKKEFGSGVSVSLFSPNIAGVVRSTLEKADNSTFPEGPAESTSESESGDDGDDIRSRGEPSGGGCEASSSSSGSGGGRESDQNAEGLECSGSKSDNKSSGSDLSNSYDGLTPFGDDIKATLAPIGVQYDIRDMRGRRSSYEIVIPSNTKLPTDTFLARGKTKLNNQTVAEIYIWEGERPVAESSKWLGRAYLTDIRPAKRGFESLDLRLNVNAAGILHAQYEAKRSKIKEYFKYKTSAWEDDSDRQ